MKTIGKEKLIADFVDRKIGYRQVYIGIIKVNERKIPYERYSNITDIDRFGNIYITDTIDILTKVNDDLYEKIEVYLTN